LWRKLAHMGIDPVGAAPAATAARAEPPPERLAAALQFATARQQPARAVQRELLSSGQVDPFHQPQRTTANEPSLPLVPADADEETLESVIASLRAAHSSFLGKDMRRVIMAAIPRREKIAIREVVRRVVESLGLEGAGHANSVSGIIDRMVEERALVSNLTQVWCKPD